MICRTQRTPSRFLNQACGKADDRRLDANSVSNSPEGHPSLAAAATKIPKISASAPSLPEAAASKAAAHAGLSRCRFSRVPESMSMALLLQNSELPAWHPAAFFVEWGLLTTTATSSSWSCGRPARGGFMKVMPIRRLEFRVVRR